MNTTLTPEQAIKAALQIISLREQDSAELMENIRYYQNGWRPVPVQNIDNQAEGIVSSLQAIRAILQSTVAPVVTRPNPEPIG